MSRAAGYRLPWLDISSIILLRSQSFAKSKFNRAAKNFVNLEVWSAGVRKVSLDIRVRYFVVATGRKCQTRAIPSTPTNRDLHQKFSFSSDEIRRSHLKKIESKHFGCRRFTWVWVEGAKKTSCCRGKIQSRLPNKCRSVRLAQRNRVAHSL